METASAEAHYLTTLEEVFERDHDMTRDVSRAMAENLYEKTLEQSQPDKYVYDTQNIKVDGSGSKDDLNVDLRVLLTKYQAVNSMGHKASLTKNTDFNYLTETVLGKYIKDTAKILTAKDSSGKPAWSGYAPTGEADTMFYTIAFWAATDD
ncbi:hypothetical protein RDn1_242 [Candidatus Termititenax dinenymphae]|uniref:Uncharacterized protein n=1 Tax=Candidatus Termititenax dinenymphae TaxID=2218523 RepID=A0A388TJV6_9BACT|nr:hypothetical protein RDn1_242 [Candidatus Termititenax dinenymphae]